jgi:hypothetical protein
LRNKCRAAMVVEEEAVAAADNIMVTMILFPC